MLGRDTVRLHAPDVHGPTLRGIDRHLIVRCELFPRPGELSHMHVFQHAGAAFTIAAFLFGAAIISAPSAWLFRRLGRRGGFYVSG